MSEFPTLAEVAAKHRPYGLDCKCGRPINSDNDWSLHLAEVWRDVCTITTVEQLDALPHGALIVCEYTSEAGWHLHELWERRNAVWYCLAAPLIPPGETYGIPSPPARVLYTPEVTR